MTTQPQSESVVEIAEKYYDSSDADEFYFHIWGGEDIHVGIYETEDEPIVEASRRTVERMASMVQGGIGPGTRVLDIGAGYGGAARYLAKTYGCTVCCLNISKTQNRRNQQLSSEQGLGDKIEVLHASFEDIPKRDGSFDLVWCQDSILHSGKRAKVLEEVKRVLAPGGQFIFTDPMQVKSCPSGVLQPVLDRIHLDSLGSFDFYSQTARKLGLEEVKLDKLSEQLPRHYGRVREELQSRYDEMIKLSSKKYVDRMIKGLGHWVEAGNNGYLDWGIMLLRKPA
jgi:sarcosine/dimethylglycine N-methyltransferase